jgi:hypothetical protein
VRVALISANFLPCHRCKGQQPAAGPQVTDKFSHAGWNCDFAGGAEIATFSTTRMRHCEAIFEQKKCALFSSQKIRAAGLTTLLAALHCASFAKHSQLTRVTTTSPEWMFEAKIRTFTCCKTNVIPAFWMARPF